MEHATVKLTNIVIDLLNRGQEKNMNELSYTNSPVD